MILITGSNTLTGKTIAARLKAEGSTFRCLDDYSKKEIPSGCETINTAFPDLKTLKKACEGVETVIHLLDKRKKGYIKRRLVKQINIDLVRNLLVAAQECGVKKLIFMSSHEIYGKQKKFPLGEDLKSRPVTRFGKDKVKAERIVQEWIKKDSLDITIIRPALVAGSRTDDPMLLITLFMAMGMEEDNRLYLAGNGENRYQMISPDDIASAVSLIISTPASRGKIYNLGSDNVPSQIEQMVKIKDSSGLNCSIKHLSPAFAKFLSIIFKPMKINYLTKEHISFLTTTMVLDCQKAKNDLGWSPEKDNLSILKETIDWYKKEKL